MLWAALNIAAALSALAATKFRTAVGGGTDRCLVLLCGGTAVAYALMGSPAAVTTFGGGVLLNVVRGLAWPLIGTAINTNISDDRLRATVNPALILAWQCAERPAARRRRPPPPAARPPGTPSIN